jgi:type IV fimbrial biogenesis protein FimT
MKKPFEMGFTLIELLTAVAVLGVLLGIGVPAFTSIMNSNRVATNAIDIVAAISVARSEAVKRGVPVAVCASNTAQTDCVDSADWTTGWIAFTDQGATIGAIDGGETIIQAWPPPSALTINNPEKIVRYLRDGSRYGATDAKITVSKASVARCITVTKPGRANLTKVACT